MYPQPLTCQLEAEGAPWWWGERAFAVIEHQAKAVLAHTMQDHALPLVSHSFWACWEGWIQPRDTDISEMQSSSSHKTRHSGGGDIVTIPHWRQGFAISAQNNLRCSIPIHEVLQSHKSHSFDVWERILHGPCCFQEHSDLLCQSYGTLIGSESSTDCYLQWKAVLRSQTCCSHQAPRPFILALPLHLCRSALHRMWPQQFPKPAFGWFINLVLRYVGMV